MIFCENCFCDSEVISIIKSKGEVGDCPFCGSKNVYLYDTDKSHDLSDIFDNLVSIYTPITTLPDNFRNCKSSLLSKELIENWDIFNNKNEGEVTQIISSICKEKYEDVPELFNQPVVIKELYDFEYLDEHSLLKRNSWDDFVDTLKTKNRYHTHFIDLELLERFLSYTRKPYKVGAIFYRCRISQKEGFSIEDMGAPPVEKTRDGRANAKGIRCLYLGDTPETTIYEVRAGLYDYVTIGEFELQQDIIVVDLKGINKISPFIEGLDCMEYAVNKENLNRISQEMSKITRKSELTLDYIPVQYITDFIKSIVHNGKQEYAGIEYGSVAYPNGFNLAIFEPEIFKCIGTEVYSIDAINYQRSVV